MTRYSFATRSVSFTAIAVQMGYRMARLKPGESAAFFIFAFTNNNGGQVPTSSYIKERYLAGLREMAESLKIPVVIAMDGADIVIQRGLINE